VIDQDRHAGGPDGVAEWDRQCAANGVDQSGCLIVETPSGGRHTYFRCGDGPRVGNSAGKIGGGIDTRGDGGYVIAPGAVLPDGRTYRVLSGSLASSPIVPADLRAFLAAKPPGASPSASPAASHMIAPAHDAGPPGPRETAYAAEVLADKRRAVERATVGERNSTFNKAIFAFATLIANYGVSAEDAEPLKIAARRAGLTDAEIEATFKSALAAGMQQPRPQLGGQNGFQKVDLSGLTANGQPIPQLAAHGQSDAPAGDHAVMRRVSDVAAEPIEWLWPTRAAIGKLTLIAGDPGLGKSQLTAWMAAKVTTTGAWPNDEGRAPLGNVIMLSCEDDIADTIRPRLEAAGADLGRVHVIESVKTATGQMRAFSITQDLPKLEQALATTRDVKLVVIDPITAYMGGSDTHKTGDVRAALAPLQELASRFHVAIVVISHFNKGSGNGKSINAVTGSTAFVAASRAALVVVRDPADAGRRLLIEAKNNLACASGLAFSIQETMLTNGIRAPRVEFEDGVVELTADQAIGEPASNPKGNAVDDAMAFLRCELADGPKPATAVFAAAKNAGIAPRTLRRAADRTGVKPHKAGYRGEWVWSFPMAPNRVAELFIGQPDLPQPPKGAQDGHPTTPENVATFGFGWPSLADKSEYDA
jgi:hypothetical protein